MGAMREKNNKVKLKWEGLRLRSAADLTGGAVGETRLVVSSQVEIGRTGTLVPSAR